MKCKSIGGYVTTPRTIYGCDNCGAWLFVHKVPLTLQEHVKTTQTDKTQFFFAKKVLHDRQLFNKVPFESTKYRKKELCVDNIKTIGDVYCPTCRNEKCVYISTNKATSFHDCEKCRACCHVLNIPLRTKNRQLCCLLVMKHIVWLEKRVATTKKKNHLLF